jgi:hypothetical protein
MKMKLHWDCEHDDRLLRSARAGAARVSRCRSRSGLVCFGVRRRFRIEPFPAVMSLMRTRTLLTFVTWMTGRSLAPPPRKQLLAGEREARVPAISDVIAGNARWELVWAWQPVVKLQLHSAGDASPLTALLLPQIFPIFSVVAPCQRGASPPSVRRWTFTTGCSERVRVTFNHGGHRGHGGRILSFRDWPSASSASSVV